MLPTYVITTGEDTIYRLIERYYGETDPEKVKEIKTLISRVNPHITSLESLSVGDQLLLPALAEGPQDEAPVEPESTSDGKKKKE
jgi:hypothetical protein